MSTSERLVAVLRQRGLTVATGESLTAGWVGGAIASVPGCSDVFRGGVIAYTADVKRTVLGLTAVELAQGLVSEEVAGAMARRVAALLGADVGLGTTGVAGPEAHGGSPVGKVCLGVWWPGGIRTWTIQCSGARDEIRRSCVAAVVAEAVELLT